MSTNTAFPTPPSQTQHGGAGLVKGLASALRPDALVPFFRGMLARWPLTIASLLVFTTLMGFFAVRVRPDYSIEQLFPTFDRSRRDYEHFKQFFPYEDAHALVIVEAPDLFEPAGLARLAALEHDLAQIPGVLETQGLTTVRDVRAKGDTIVMERLFPRPDMPKEELKARKHIATTDPLFAWTLAHPSGKATTIRVTLTKEQAATDARRTEFTQRARAVLAAHASKAQASGVSQKLTLNGLPVIRTEFTEMINKDLGRLFPIALGLILVLLFVAFRSIRDVGAAFFAIVFAALWTTGVMGMLGVPLHVLTQITPIIVMVVSISDTVHIVAHCHELCREGRPHRDAIAHALADSAGPCLLTELTIAGGFLSLLGNDMVAIQQFGLVTAAGVLLAWAANMTVLPVALSFATRRTATPSQPQPSRLSSVADRFVRWVSRTVEQHPGRVAAVTGLIVALAIASATRIGKEYYSYDDLRPESQLYRNLRYMEAIHGGVVPLAIHIEPKDPARRVPDAMLEPEALRLIDRLTRGLEAEFSDDIRNAASLTKYLRKAHRLLAGEEGARTQPLPRTRALASQELLAIDDPAALRNLLSFDRSSAAIFVMMPDHGSSKATKVIARMNDLFAAESRNTPYRVTLTGIYGIADGIYRSMVGGLLASLGIAVLVSFAVFCVVLRSLWLALIALVPNLLPLLLTLGMMSALRIDIKPTTVLIFSITLVIADDDTIQYLSRFRRRFFEIRDSGHPAPHAEAAHDVLVHTGRPMLITTVAVTLGFLTLLFSEFLGLANLGLLIGVSLFSAVFADLFLSPLLITRLRPRRGALRTVGPEPEPQPHQAADPGP